MAEAGILHEDDRVELIGGEIVEMSPIGTRHLACVVALNHLLVASSEGRYFVSVQNPIFLGDNDEPQPDMSLLAERPRPVAETPPGPGEVRVAIEVSDTTLSYDRNVKLPLYAQTGIPEVWIVDLRNQAVEVHAGLEGGRYTKVGKYRRTDELRSESVPGLTLPVQEILG